MASGRVLTVQEVSELLGFWQWPLKARYTDTQYPGEQEMYFFGDATLEFMNERGNWSDRHAHWSFFYEPSIYDASNELRLRVRDFHCTGTWGVNQGYAKELMFECLDEYYADRPSYLRCAATGHYADRVAMVAHLPGLWRKRGSADMPENSGPAKAAKPLE